jgi:HK97 family phage major capsid protein
LTQAAAIGLDLAALHGTGSSNQPTGIINVSGIGLVSGGTNGLAPTWANMVALETEVAQDNADIGSVGYLTNAKVRGKMKTVEKASGTAQFLWNDGADGFGMVNGYRAGVSNQVASNLTKGTASSICSAAFFGNWADLLIGEWGAIEIIQDPYSKKKQGLVEVTSFVMADIAVRHAQSFAVNKDILTT